MIKQIIEKIKTEYKITKRKIHIFSKEHPELRVKLKKILIMQTKILSSHAFYVIGNKMEERQKGRI